MTTPSTPAMQRVPTDMFEALDATGVLQFPPIDASGDVTSSTILRGSLVEQAQIATPTTRPPAGSMLLYPKADSNYYSLDSAGVERLLGGGTGGGGDPLDPWKIDEFGNLVPKVTGDVDLGSQSLRPANLWARNKLLIGGLTYWDGVSLNDIGEMHVPDTFALSVGSAAPLYVTETEFQFWKPLHFRDDNLHDIGSSTTWGRPRDLFLGRDIFVGRNLTVNGTGVTTGSFSIYAAPPGSPNFSRIRLHWDDPYQPTINAEGGGTTAHPPAGLALTVGGAGRIRLMSGASQTAIMLAPNGWGTGTEAKNPIGVRVEPTFGNTADSYASVMDASFGFLNLSGVTPTVYMLRLVSPYMGIGNTITSLYGLYVSNLGQGSMANVYGIYISAQSGATTSNIGLVNMGLTRLGAALEQVQIATPVNPPAGWMRLYPKADGEFYKLDSAGVETPLGGGGGGGGLTLPLGEPLTFAPDNTHDIGANTASRPRDAYVGGKVYLGDGNTAWIGRGDSANSVQFSAGIQPLTANSGNIGEAHRKFNALFLSGGMVSNSWEMIGTNSRITGPMGWTDPAGRFYLQASGVADPTWVNARPNNAGTGGTAAGWRAFQLGDQANSPYAAFGIDATGALIDVGKFGTATTLPLVVKFDGVEKLRLALNGDLTVVGNVTTPRVGAPGTATDLILATGGVDRWHIDDTTGCLRPAALTYDIGRSGSEVRDIHVKRAVGIGVSPTTYYGISFKGVLTGGTGPQVGVFSNPSFDSTISTYGACFYSQPKTVTGTGNVAAVYGLICFGPMLGSSSEIFNATGIYVASQELVGTKAIGIQIADQGSANVGLLNNGRTELNAPVDMELLTASQQVAPASGKIRLYANATTGHLHQKSSSGADLDLAAGGGSGGVTWPLLAPDGTASAPSYAFTSDARLGIMKSTAGGVAITAGGWERLRVHGSGATVSGTLDFSGYMEMTKQVAPVVPATNKLRVYASSVTGHLHQIDSAGVDTDLAAGGGGGLTLPLAQALTFSPDATHDIGPAGQRPRAIHAGGTIRSTGQTVPTEGVGLEMQYQSSNGIAYLSAYNRGGNAAIPLTIQGSRVTIEGPLYGSDYSFAGGSIYGNSTGAWVNSKLTAMQASLGLVNLQPLAMGSIWIEGGYPFKPVNASGVVEGIWCGWVQLNSGIIKNGSTNVGVSDLGLYSVQAAQWVRIASCTNELNLFTDGGAGNGYGGTTPNLSLKTSGDVTNHRAAMNATAFNVTSSARFKTNLLPFPDADALARVISPLAGLVTWDSYYKAPPPKAKGSAPSAGPEYIPNARQIGFTAEDMEAIVPEVVAHDEQDLPATVAYDNLVAVLWGALREYVARTDARIAALEAQR